MWLSQSGRLTRMAALTLSAACCAGKSGPYLGVKD